MITPTRLSDDSTTLIDYIFTYKQGILTTPISDNLLNFCVFEDNHVYCINKNMFLEIDEMSTNYINTFGIP